MSDKDVLISMGFDPDRVEWALRATNNNGLQPAMNFIGGITEAIPIPGWNQTSTNQPQSGPRGEDDEEDAVLLGLQPGAAATMSAKDVLISMGIDPDRVEWALRATNNSGLQPAMNFIIEHMDEAIPIPEWIQTSTNQAQSRLRGEDGGKDAAMLGLQPGAAAMMSDNDISMDMKPKDDSGALRATNNNGFQPAMNFIWGITEAIPIPGWNQTSTNQPQSGLRGEDYEEDATLLGLRPSAAAISTTASTAPAAAAAAPATSSLPGREFQETRLQIRLASGGHPLTMTLPSDSILREVAEFVAGQTLTVDVDTVTFAQQFPRKQFSSSDFSRTLRDLGLTPSAALIAS